MLPLDYENTKMDVDGTSESSEEVVVQLSLMDDEDFLNGFAGSAPSQGASGALKTIIAGAGFMADAYDLFVINVAVDIMGSANYAQKLSTETESLVKGMALLGAILGQLVFGFFADQIGRHRIFLTTGACIIVGALLSASAVDNQTFGIYSQLMLYRFMLGFGVGGEYPLSATITSESSDERHKVTNLAAVFSMQGIGAILSSLVLVIVTRTITDPNVQWRVALAFGAVPVIFTYYFRWVMGESKAWASYAAEKTVRASRLESLKVALCTNGRLLLGTAGAWLILDVVFYANGLFSGDVTTAMGLAGDTKGEALQALIVQCFAMVGYFFTIAFIRRIGPKRLQVLGYLATALMFFLMAALQPKLQAIAPLYIIMYGITFFFQNFGPNATTYIIPSVVFPTETRATCHGISAAAGKVGAVVGVQLLLPLVNFYCTTGDCHSDEATAQQRDKGLQLTFGVCATLALLGTLWSVLLVSDKATRVESAPTFHAWSEVHHVELM